MIAQVSRPWPMRSVRDALAGAFSPYEIDRVIARLWSNGYTIAHRIPEVRLFDAADGLAPEGMEYQWAVMPADVMVDAGWRPVTSDRHDGVFMPWGSSGAIVVGGCMLMEREKEKNDAAREADLRAAEKLETDWAKRLRADVDVAVRNSVAQQHRGSVTDSPPDRDVPDAMAIPQWLSPYISEIFTERDAIKEEEGVDDALATMRAILIVKYRHQSEEPKP